MNSDETHSTSRRQIFGGIAGGAAIGLIGLASTSAEAMTDAAGPDGPDWPGKLTGRHRQVVDAYEVNSGFPLAFAHSFIATNAPGSATAVVVLRHAAAPIALESAMWEKYKIGEALKIIDPETKAPAVKNPFLRPKHGALPLDEMAVDKLMDKGAIVGACHLALAFQAKMLAAHAGMSADAALKDWMANVVPGITVIPSGTWGVNRAQEAGCTYCTGGG